MAKPWTIGHSSSGSTDEPHKKKKEQLPEHPVGKTLRELIAEWDVEGHQEADEARVVYQNIVKDVDRILIREPRPDGTFKEGTIVRVKVDEDEEVWSTGIILNDFAFEHEFFVETLMEEGKRYDVLFFTNHRPFTTKVFSEKDIQPVFTDGEFFEAVVKKGEISMTSAIVACLAAVQHERGCPSCGRRYKSGR